MTTRHERETIAAFQSGETALVYARWRDRPEEPPYFLVDGSASDPAVKGLAVDLECFLPDCPDRRLSIVNRHSSVRIARDGFRHRSGAGGHTSPESLFHKTAKETIRRWVLNHRPDLGVAIEVPLSGRERVADVMITWPDGTRLAIEVQYADLSVVDLEERTESYRAAGVAVQWVFGHIAPQFRSFEDFDGRTVIWFGDTHRAAARGPENVLWLNPIAPSIASPLITREEPGIDGSWQIPPTDEDEWVSVTVEDFDDRVSLDPVTGFGSRSAAEWRRQRDELLAAIAERDRLAADEAARRLAEERAKKAIEDAERGRRLAESHEHMRRSGQRGQPEDWSKKEPGVLRREHLTTPLPGDAAFHTSPQEWRAAVRDRFLADGGLRSRTLSVTHAAMCLQEDGRARDDLDKARDGIREFLALLIEAEIVYGPLYGGQEIYGIVGR